jgi:hypothetical protein
VKHIFIVFLIVVAGNAIAQDGLLFRVVSFSEGVTIDGTEPR